MQEVDTAWITSMPRRTIDVGEEDEEEEADCVHSGLVPSSFNYFRNGKSRKRRRARVASETQSLTFGGVGERWQFNCSAENGLHLNDSESPGEAMDINNSKTECSQALVRLLEDLKNTLVESAKTCNASLRESTITSIETVLRQIRARLSEPVISESLSYKSLDKCLPRSSDVSTVLREVENSIRSLREGSCKSDKLSHSTVRLPALKVNSIELLPPEMEQTHSSHRLVPSTQEAAPCENSSTPNAVVESGSLKDPVEPVVAVSQCSDSLKMPPREEHSSLRRAHASHSMERSLKSQASGSSNAEHRRPASVRSHTQSSKGSPSPHDSPMAPSGANSRISNKSSGSQRSNQPTREKASCVKSVSESKVLERSRSKRSSAGSDRDKLKGGSRGSNAPPPVKSESITSKAVSEPYCIEDVNMLQTRMDSATSRPSVQPQCSSSKDQLVPPSNGCAPNEDRRLATDMETGSRKLTKLSKILRSFRSHSSRSSRSKTGSPIGNPLELCAKLLTICTGNALTSQLETCSPETLYAKISAMGPAGEEFLQSAQDYLKASYGKQPCNSMSQDPPLYSRQTSAYKEPLQSKKESEGMHEVAQTKRSYSRSSTKTLQEFRGTEVPEKCAKSSTSKVDQDGLLEKPMEVQILETLKEVYKSMQNIETKQDKVQMKVDPEVLELLYDMHSSLNSPNRGYESDAHEAVKCVYNAGPRNAYGLITTTVEEVVDPNVDFRSPSSRLSPHCATRLGQKAKMGVRSTPVEEGMEASEVLITLNEIRQSICAIESRDANSPGPEVLRMLTEVRDSIRILSTAQQEQTPVQPEVLNALEEIRETIASVEERTHAAQEQANQEMMAMLESVQQCIHSIEIENAQKSDLKNKQMMATLNEMRQSVSRLETKSVMSEKKLNPAVASLLGEIRASIRCMEKSRASQRSAADSTMMDILRDIKGSLISIEGRASSTAQRPSVNMFVMNGSKRIVNEETLNSLTGIRRSGDIATTPRSNSKSCPEKSKSLPTRDTVQSRNSEPNVPPPPAVSTDSCAKTTRDEIHQNMEQMSINSRTASKFVDDPKYCEMKETILMIQKDMRTLMEKQTEVLGQLSRDSGAAQLQGLSEELADIRSGMKCLIDTIPSIVEAVRPEPPPVSLGQQVRACISPPICRPSRASVDGDDAELQSPMCKKVMEMLEEMKAADEMENEVLRCARIPSPVAELQDSEAPNVNSPLSTPPVALWKTEPVVPTGVGPSCMKPSIAMPVTSPDQLPSTFTLSFVGPQPQALNLSQPMIININGRTFKCSKMST